MIADIKNMGLNISLHKLPDKNDVHSAEPDDKRFDFIRYSGDVEFHQSVEWETVRCKELHYCDQYFSRPKDFKKARQWVKKNVFKGNQKRLLDVLDLMEKEEDLYLRFSY